MVVEQIQTARDTIQQANRERLEAEYRISTLGAELTEVRFIECLELGALIRGPSG